MERKLNEKSNQNDQDSDYSLSEYFESQEESDDQNIPVILIPYLHLSLFFPIQVLF